MSRFKREQVFNLPNLITLVRVGSIPLLMGLLYLPQPAWHWTAALLFLVAGLSDLADGLLARRLKKVTVLGQFLDPLADKLLVTSMLVVLVMLGRAEAWAAVIIICREVAVTGLRAVAATQGLAVPSDRWARPRPPCRCWRCSCSSCPSPWAALTLTTGGPWPYGAPPWSASSPGSGISCVSTSLHGQSEEPH